MQRARIRDFIWAFGAEWSIAMSGPLSVPLAIAGVLSSNDTVKATLFVISAACLVVGSYLIWKRERIKVIQVSPRLDIIYVANERRYDENKQDLHWGIKTISVAVKNIGATGLSNCQLYFDGISTEDGNLPKGCELQKGLPPFKLNGSETLFFKLLRFEERAQCTAGNLFVPFALDRDAGYRTFDRAGAHIITLRATAAECAPCIRRFKFWVDSSHHLKMERIEETSTGWRALLTLCARAIGRTG